MGSVFPHFSYTSDKHALTYPVPGSPAWSSVSKLGCPQWLPHTSRTQSVPLKLWGSVVLGRGLCHALSCCPYRRSRRGGRLTSAGAVLSDSSRSPGLHLEAQLRGWLWEVGLEIVLKEREVRKKSSAIIHSGGPMPGKEPSHSFFPLFPSVINTLSKAGSEPFKSSLSSTKQD